MTTAEYLLNIGLLGYVLSTNLGARQLTRRRFTLPVLLVAVAGYAFLRGLSTAGNDSLLELAGLTAGVLLGALAALLVSLERRADGTVVAHAGAGFATLWVVVIGGRMLFAYGADHWFPAAIAGFSRRHEITGAGAWTAAFVLMALAMVLTRLAVTGAQAARLPRTQAVPSRI